MAVNGISTTTVNTNQRNCRANCQCNNQHYTGICKAGICKVTQREQCQVRGAKDDCILEASTGCRDGIRICQDDGLESLRWGDCKAALPVAEVGPELCRDGKDNDCDGKTDKGDPDCKDVCQPGAERDCYSGPKNTQKKGRCKNGKETCKDNGLWSGVCEGEILPVKEVCNFKDDDCDGRTDENLPRCESSSCQQGEKRFCYSNANGCTWSEKQRSYQCQGLCKAGIQLCTTGNIFEKSICRGESLPQQEKCNGQDDDCDGEVDENLTQPCYSAASGCNLQSDGTYICEGPCKAGTQSCSNGSWGVCSGQVLPTKELCDGIDQNCDGNIDENYAKKGKECNSGQGECAGKGLFVCTTDKTGLICDAKIGTPSQEICNNKDDNCDGKIDESISRPCYPAPSNTKGVGTCKEGKEVCTNGNWSSCSGGTFPQVESCDGKDNDCDGRIDEGIAWCVSTIAGSGNPDHKDGVGTAADFKIPTGVAFDDRGNLYIADKNNHKIRKIDPSGKVSTFAGSGVQGNKDGTGVAAQFYSPQDVCVDSSGNVYVADSGNHRIRKITPTGVVTTLAGSTRGFKDGSGQKALFNNPTGLTIQAGELYVADLWNYSIRKIDPTGKVTTFAGNGVSGYKDGERAQALFRSPSKITVDQNGNLYISGRMIRRINSPFKVQSVAGSGKKGDMNGSGAVAQFGTLNDLVRDGKGNLFVVDYSNHKIRKIDPTGQVTTFAGSTPGYKDGTGATAQFYLPQGIALGPAGNLYVTDAGNSKIRKIDPTGKVTTLAGSTAGYKDGIGAAAQFQGPTGIAIDSKGNLYISDYGSHKIRKLDPTGKVTTLAGSSAGYKDGTGASAKFNRPNAVAVDATGNLYVADQMNHKIRKVTSSGVVTTVAGSTAGYKDGVGAAAQFDNPFGIVLDLSGNLYVSETHRIRKVTPTGKVTSIAGNSFPGYQNKVANLALFNFPRGLEVDSSNNLYVTDSENYRVRSIDLTGKVTTLAGLDTYGFKDGPGKTAKFFNPNGLSVDSLGNVYVADLSNHRIRKIDPTGNTTTVAGNGTPGHTNGIGSTTQFSHPWGVAIDSFDRIYVADSSNHRIRRMTLPGVVTTLAGSGERGFKNGIGQSAKFYYVGGLAVDAAGNVYVADRGNHRIRKVDSTGKVTTFAGSGVKGYKDGLRTTAQFHSPEDIAFDSSGNLYVSDFHNNRIRKIDPSGNVTTIAGNGNYGYKNGVGIKAEFNRPEGIAVDKKGNIYVVDRFNQRIRKIDPTGKVTTFAGSGSVGYKDGKGILAEFNYPIGIAIDRNNNVYVTDYDNHRIRKIDPTGNVTTFVGSSLGYKDGVGRIAQLNKPTGITVDPSGNIYVSDSHNSKIRVISPKGKVTTLTGSSHGYQDGELNVAQFGLPGWLAVDRHGRIYVSGEERIRRIKP